MTINITAQEKEILKTVVIPPRPEALLKFSEEAKKDEPNIGILAQAIHSDVGISAAILQVVNSAAFRRAKEVESIDQAVMVLGLKRIIPLVKAVALKSAVQASKALSDFWQDQSDIATACSLIANELHRPELANHSYMLGLFHSAGVPILFQHFDNYSEILSSATESGWDAAVQDEYAKFDTSHTSIGAVLAQQWKLPKTMVNVIYYQHDVGGIYDSGELDKTALILLSILKLARYCIAYKRTNDADDCEWCNIRDALYDFMELTETDVEQLRNKVLSQL